MAYLLIQNLVKFNTWANHKVLVKTAALPHEDLTAFRVPGQRSILDTLVHILDAQWYWRNALQTGVLPKNELTPADFQTLTALKIRWDQDDNEFIKCLAAFPEVDSDPVIYYRWESDRKSRQPRSRRLSDIVLHIVMHAAQHRSELAFQLTELGQSPGDLDYMKFLTLTQKKQAVHE